MPFVLLPTAFAQRTLMRFLTIIALLLVFPGGCASRSEQTQAELRQLRDQVAALQRSQAELSARIEELSNTVFIVEDKVDTNRQYIATLKKNQAMRIVSLAPESPSGGLPQAVSEPARTAAEARVVAEPPAKSAANPPPAVKSAPAPAPTPAPPAKVTPPAPKSAALERSAAVVGAIDNPVAYYKQSLGYYEAKQWNECIAAFSRFARELPDHELADNSLYWEGECFYSQDEHKKALEVFDRLVERYPGGNKAPAALLKMALSHRKLGNKQRSEEALQKLLNQYPFSDVAANARSVVENAN